MSLTQIAIAGVLLIAVAAIVTAVGLFIGVYIGGRVARALDEADSEDADHDY